jgi:hypothetical protein
MSWAFLGLKIFDLESIESATNSFNVGLELMSVELTMTLIDGSELETCLYVAFEMNLRNVEVEIILLKKCNVDWCFD